MVEGSCKIIGHGKRGCTGLCNLTKFLPPRRYRQLVPNETEKQLFHAEGIEFMENYTGARCVLDGLEKVKRMRYMKLRNATNATSVTKIVNGTEDMYLDGYKFKALIHKSKTGTKFEVGFGIYKWQRREPYGVVLRRFLDDDQEFMNEAEIMKTWNQEDTVFVPRSCSHE